MADFHQNGIITTLHNLGDRPLEELEADLRQFSKRMPMALVLPCLYSELATDAMPNILEHLKKVDYLEEIVVGLDKATKDEYHRAINFFSALPTRHKVLWNDGPRLRALDADLAKEGLAPKEPGKGRNVWYCLGYIQASNRCEAIALHDCDILTYDRSLLARLLYPVANPAFNFQFCKGYYARVASGKMNGRVSRLLVTPLIKSLQKIFGTSEYLEYLDSFRYPLAGEFSFRRDVVTDMRMPSDWGLEIGILSEARRNFSANKLCQVDIADFYDHKHQDLSAEDATQGLSKMSIDICKTIFSKLATDGTVFSQETFRTIKATYFRVALDFVENYRNDAIMNGMELDLHKEERAVELFARNIMEAGSHFLANPMEAPFIHSWNRVISAAPDILERLEVAVAADMADAQQ